MKHFESLLRPGERLDLTQYPWPKPKEGEIIRAECLFDLDPQNTSADYHIKRLVANAEVYSVGESANPRLDIFYYTDAEGHPLPEEERCLSDYEHEFCRRWGGVKYWPQDPNDSLWRSSKWIPLAAIKKRLLADYAQRLKRNAENAQRGIYQ